MMMSDAEITKYMKEGYINIKPFNERNLGPSSYDLTVYNVGRTFLHKTVLDITKDVPASKEIALPYILSPRETIILMTKEIISCSDEIAADIACRSNISRLPLYYSSGFVDPGFSGPLTLRVTNVGDFPIKISPDVRIAQIRFYTVDKCNVSYNDRQNSKNVGQTHNKVPNFKPDKEWLR